MIKRLFDVVISLLGLIVFSPLFPIVAVLIKMDSKGPVFFCQERLGRNFRPFMIYKFRTMNINSVDKGFSVTARRDARITRVGSMLRRTKIDEMPQLYNVLKGDMSIVGPRPEITKYIDMFKEDYKTILKVKPGITDYAAIEFRDEEAVLEKYDDPEKGYIEEVLPKKIVLYNSYLKKRGLVVDIRIIWFTICRIIK